MKTYQIYPKTILTFLTIILAWTLSAVELQANSSLAKCATLKTTSTAHLFQGINSSRWNGLYGAGRTLHISRISGNRALVRWPQTRYSRAGQGWIKKSSFSPSAFNRARSNCGGTTGHTSMEFAPDGSIIRPRRGASLDNINIATSDNHSCLPAVVKQKLASMANMGWKIQLLSAHRSRRDNARRKGDKGSLHIQCRAADFKVLNVPRATVEKHLMSSWAGGPGLYCSGRFHIDNGNHRMWGNCASATNKRTYYSRNNRATRTSTPRTSSVQ